MRLGTSTRSNLALSLSAVLLSTFLNQVAEAHPEDEEGEKKEQSEEKSAGEKKSKLEVSGYGELVATYFDYGPNQKASSRGSKRDQRVLLDTRRFSLEVEGELPRGFMFEAELEVEHGGTGSAVELEYEEAGEYENEIEKGGEVVFEKLFLEKAFDAHRFRIGRFPVAIGMLPNSHEPLDYLGAVRAESESHIIPDAWSEMGLDYRLKTANNSFQFQLINGLDSSGFSSQDFIVGGYQTRFDEVKATDPAGVMRWSTRYIPGLETGLSVYYGDTSRNRPQADLTKKCSKGSNSNTANSVAPCDYVKTPITIISWHAKGEWDRIIAQASAVSGHIENASDINNRNASISTKYVGVLRSPVAERAYSAWAEAGYAFDGFDELDRIIPFARYETYDTVFKRAPGQVDQDRLARRVWSIGADYLFAKSVVFKLDTARRSFGSKDLRVENEVRFNTSFLF
ncbi:MAG: hypothetical protein EOP07_07110 [Proteobacteria bacterium]|nr:MAG: hypothetical protein EOP07_07110 [Pseudomonadota bacterium]